jgi:hypothetical protein
MANKERAGFIPTLGLYPATKISLKSQKMAIFPLEIPACSRLYGKQYCP